MLRLRGGLHGVFHIESGGAICTNVAHAKIEKFQLLMVELLRRS
jgi:hypothetical protein